MDSSPSHPSTDKRKWSSVAAPFPSCETPDGGSQTLSMAISQFSAVKNKSTRRFEEMIEALEASIYRRSEEVGGAEAKKCEDARDELLKCYQDQLSVVHSSSSAVPYALIDCVPKMQRYKKCVNDTVFANYYDRTKKVREIATAKLGGQQVSSEGSRSAADQKT